MRTTSMGCSAQGWVMRRLFTYTPFLLSWSITDQPCTPRRKVACRPDTAGSAKLMPSVLGVVRPMWMSPVSGFRGSSVQSASCQEVEKTITTASGWGRSSARRSMRSTSPSCRRTPSAAPPLPYSTPFTWVPFRLPRSR